MHGQTTGGSVGHTGPDNKHAKLSVPSIGNNGPAILRLFGLDSQCVTS